MLILEHYNAEETSLFFSGKEWVMCNTKTSLKQVKIMRICLSFMSFYTRMFVQSYSLATHSDNKINWTFHYARLYKVVIIFKARLELYKKCTEKYTRISPKRIKYSYDLWYNVVMVSPADALNWSVNKPGIAQVELSRAIHFLKHTLSGRWNVYMAIYKQ